MAVIEISSQDQFSDLTSVQNKLIAIYFHTPWAAPCIQMNKVISTLGDSAQHQETTFLSINADDHPDISDLFDVSAVPYFVLIRNGTILKELSGADPKEFVAALDQFSNKPTTTQSPLASVAPQTQHQQESQNSQLEGQKQQAQQDNPVFDEETPEQLNARLTKLTTAAPIMLFMKGTPSAPQCGFSRQLVAILREHQVRFGFFDILKDDAVRNGLKSFSDWPTFPQLYIGGIFQGGLDIIKENLSEDEHFFEHALEDANNSN
ncbi:hypothetical protein CANARDRAFT_203002 [[Candida] arabinofermentans NRRL YB-2248]|uniref:Thioredoxin domain-containing protein n=1 Tax=[Candida] arabinofermentans NRRL YB-2248 TaxID=983967 RepID=A0A1E4SVC8_9ASCO|nr:hypothetical protein CANARDRAFT_203002 [[Candida] arabinofermentans NRRL YB-2248]